MANEKLAAGWYVIQEHGLQKLVQVIHVGHQVVWRYGSDHFLRTFDEKLFQFAERVEF